MKKSQILLTSGLLVSLLLIYNSVTAVRHVNELDATAVSGDFVAFSPLEPGSSFIYPGRETGDTIRISLVTGLAVLIAVVLLGGLTLWFGRGRITKDNIENRQRVKKASTKEGRPQHAAYH